MHSRVCLVLLLGTIFSLAACGGASNLADVNPAMPAAIPARTTARINVAGLHTDLLPTQEIGEVNSGKWHSTPLKLYMGTLTEKDFPSFYQSISVLLRQAGYQVIEAPDPGQKAEVGDYLINGQLLNAKLFHFGPSVGNRGFSECTIQWEVIEVAASRRVYQRTITTTGQTGFLGPAALKSVENSFSQVLADEQFASAMTALGKPIRKAGNRTTE